MPHYQFSLLSRDFKEPDSDPPFALARNVRRSALPLIMIKIYGDISACMNPLVTPLCRSIFLE